MKDFLGKDKNAMALEQSIRGGSREGGSMKSGRDLKIGEFGVTGGRYRVQGQYNSVHD